MTIERSSRFLSSFALHVDRGKSIIEKSLMDVGWEDAPEDVDLTPELEPALVCGRRRQRLEARMIRLRN